MLKNYIITATRKLRRERGYALVNVLGLSLGTAVCLIVMLLVYDQWSYDRFHDEHERIVRIVVRGERAALAATPAVLGPTLKRELPFVEQSLRIGQIRADVEAGGKAFALEGLAADPSFLDLFDFELLAGDRSTVSLCGRGFRDAIYNRFSASPATSCPTRLMGCVPSSSTTRGMVSATDT
jgi:putative ABC transport system permease protein